ncbi:MAG: LysM peptidoglycan-binding domain-containing protein [Chloroflexi bacterium]|nr:MAG: LysM peptidoglycan-binding domain-containing protein [Chloroflexota bacterium]
MSFFNDLYIKFMVWLGAEPPEGYEHLVSDKPRPKTPAAPDVEVPLPAKEVTTAEPEPVPEPEPVSPPESAEPLTPIIEPEPWTPPEPAAKPEPEPTPAPEQEAESVAPPPDKDAGWLETAPTPPEITEPTAPHAPAEATEEAAQLPLAETLTPAAAPEQDMPFRYEVQRGDTYNAIAKRYGLTVKKLFEANQIDDPNRIFPGQKLVIPGYTLRSPEPEPETPKVAPPHVEPSAEEPFIYTVAGGDTLNTIAKRYGITVRELIEANDLADPALIHVGQKLVIPGVIMPPSGAKPGATTDSAPPPAAAPDTVRAIYVSYFALGHDETRRQIFNLLDQTELNAVVIDVKGDHGWISFPTQNTTAHEIEAARPAATDFNAFMSALKDRNIYTIARIVTFKDNLLAKSHPELAAKTETGQLWQDAKKSHWCDPFQEAVWNYNAQIGVEATRLGFDEIQFDSVRFPSIGKTQPPQFAQEANKKSRVAAITGFLSAARGQLRPFGVRVSARTLGYACWRKDDSVIGQDIEKMAEYLDVLCPMLFPSTLHKGIPGFKISVEHPYEVVKNSALRAVERLAPLGCEVRPWIQDFQDYYFDKRTFGKAEIQAQIRGCLDAGSSGFMVWNPKAQYTAEAYTPVANELP